MTTRTYPADPKKARIRELNDRLRFGFAGGEVLITSSITALPTSLQVIICDQMRKFDTFTPDNDPHGEHDFGSFNVQGHKVCWKIDYYAPDMLHGSNDPADPAVTRRVLTLMLAEEY